MMDAFLFKYIEYLLPEYNCVTIPDFGSFIANIEPAQYTLNDGTCKVPCYKIIFNPDLKHNDGLLASHIHTTEGISYKAAQAKLKAAVKNSKIVLNQERALHCGRIGTIRLDDNNLIRFSANKEIVNPHLYGLSSVGLLRLHELTERELMIRPKYRFKYIYGTAAAAAAVLLFFAMPGTNVQDGISSANHQQAGFVSSLTLNTMPETHPLADNVIALESDVEEAQMQVHPYYIIIGGDISLKRANQLLERVKQSDFPNAEIIDSSDRYRISVASFADKLEGEIYLEKFRQQNPEYETAWLFTHRP